MSDCEVSDDASSRHLRARVPTFVTTINSAASSVEADAGGGVGDATSPEEVTSSYRHLVLAGRFEASPRRRREQAADELRYEEIGL